MNSPKIHKCEDYAMKKASHMRFTLETRLWAHLIVCLTVRICFSRLYLTATQTDSRAEKMQVCTQKQNKKKKVTSILVVALLSLVCNTVVTTKSRNLPGCQPARLLLPHLPVCAARRREKIAVLTFLQLSQGIRASLSCDKALIYPVIMRVILR